MTFPGPKDPWSKVRTFPGNMDRMGTCSSKFNWFFAQHKNFKALYSNYWSQHILFYLHIKTVKTIGLWEIALISPATCCSCGCSDTRASWAAMLTYILVISGVSPIIGIMTLPSRCCYYGNRLNAAYGQYTIQLLRETLWWVLHGCNRTFASRLHKWIALWSWEQYSLWSP